jgi:MFS family permease
VTGGAEAGPTPVLSRLARLAPPPGPIRLLAVAMLVNMVGSGLYLATAALFFVRFVGLSAQQVGLGLTLAMFAGIAALVPVGWVTDRVGSRAVFIALQFLQAVAMALFPLVHGFAAFLAVLCLAVIGTRTAQPVGSALIAELSGAEHRTRDRAHLRSVINLGVGIGLVLAGFVIASGSRTAYVVLIAANAASFAIAGLLLFRLPRTPAPAAPTRAGWTLAVRDRPYLVVAAVSGILACQYDLLTIVVPLWVVDHTAAPRWIVAGILVINTVLVVLFQVSAARGADGLAAAGRIGRRGGLFLLLGCGAFALAAGAPAVVAVVAVVLAAVLHTLGELHTTTSSFVFSYDLAQEHAHGQYQAAFSLATGVVRAAAPVLLTTACLSWGRPGWLAVGAAFGLAGLATPPLVRWAGHRSGRPGEAVRA